jgi:UDP-hydrolysing UDP-N-acetyl-D-glucosamine 2-epimerase
MRTIGVVTTSRADYGIYLPVLRKLSKESGLEMRLFVSGMHLSPDFGLTVKAIEADGFTIQERVVMLLASDTPEAIAKSMGLGTLGFAQAFARWKPDILVVLGDRFEMHAAAVAALPFKIPVAHLYGGEVTRGAIDDALRHSMTKLSHLHFVSTKEYGQRVVQLGEDPWRVTVCGAASLDNIQDFHPISTAELESRVGMALPERGFLLVTYHPVTLEHEQTGVQADALLAALEEIRMPTVFTLPNADTAGREIRDRITAFVTRTPSTRALESLGTTAYFSLMAQAAAMVGNSSSGLIEAPTFSLPVVNIGSRQEGRVRSANVIDVGYGPDQILDGLAGALAPSFRESLEGLVNPHWVGGAAQVVASRLREIPLGQSLILKRFYDISVGEGDQTT